MSISPLGKSAARLLLHQAGGLRGIRFWNRRGVRILMYHNFQSDPELQQVLDKQCAHIKRYYQVVSMTDIAKFLREGTPLPPNALAVTVDDGIRNFLHNGHPVFKAYQIPVTVYLVSGFIDKKLWYWWDQIRYMFPRSRRTTFQLNFVKGEPPIPFMVATPEQRQQAIDTITETLKVVGETARRDALVRLQEALDVDLPSEPPPQMAPLEWDEVRHLAKDGVEFGAHTVTHSTLSRISDPAEVLEEIQRSKQRIEEELDRPVLHFSYPYGGREHFNDTSVKAVDQCRFQSAVTTIEGLNDRATHPYYLKRFGVDLMTPEFYFQETLAGLQHLVATHLS